MKLFLKKQYCKAFGHKKHTINDRWIICTRCRKSLGPIPEQVRRQRELLKILSERMNFMYGLAAIDIKRSYLDAPDNIKDQLKIVCPEKAYKVSVA